MSEEQNISKTQAEHLDKLLQFVPASQLRKSVLKAFFSYLLEQDKSFDATFKETVENIYFLTDFLEKVDIEK